MKRIARALAGAATLGLSTVALSGPALAWGLGYGNGPTYYGEYAPLAYDSYAFGYEYPAYTGGEVTATAVELFNYRFRHRRVVGPAVVYYRGGVPRAYRVNRYW
jgi:hypothetical protein